MDAAIEIDGLRKVYRRLRGEPVVAVAGLDLIVPSGGVFGFLGPNGSGKTTTIRCLLGLVRPSSGMLRVVGEAVPQGLPVAIRSIGSVVETPALFPTMTGRENLHLLARIDRIPVRRADDLLEELGLGARSGQQVRRYSLGMKQRLGLAAALLKDPALLILDEPVNGLDPAGIRDIRRLLRRLGDEGRTVFLSSHLLSEVEHVCDAVAILRNGRCVANGTVRDVLHQTQPPDLIVRVPDLAAGATTLADGGWTVRIDDGALRVTNAAGGGGTITEALAASGQWVTELRAEDASLEQMFLELTGADQPAQLEGVA
jgi:ABC-2 type transport system ATP-binding protein